MHMTAAINVNNINTPADLNGAIALMARQTDSSVRAAQSGFVAFRAQDVGATGDQGT